MPPVKALEDAETLGDLRRNYESLLAKQRENENKSEATKAEIAKKEQDIQDSQEALTQAEKEEQETQEKIEASNKRIEE